ncbi:APC family permease [Mesorhizobium sp. M4B.F.Ca.ET.215.01.1.1]|uniref:APC family permease n=1 Tax=unclassified Mesorhizobium TaxID=325217 RepID=UPI000FCC7F2F|nr:MULTISPECIES: APC family permease [unclassified Mesorhizobium]RUW26086.1 APC family permease [Mesorhizobium sp. M4B.F.Ca.ET.013.02.1.1]RVD41611.1 APC family permease [Mesorhizobium sp. M4B.F.Ca.ET.019.03.1.1]RWF63158.1 MAG: APC family permease [Mesorhizobium sp.]TGQ09470.1 APC family permease [Mesorhizobium sp. M4B.F.Ca.ET.215.01.1.1]TGQ31181.1 APC family permease [Mesorhizobium sp. M4B.F.Ca.ET.214.01.1.1]
MSTAGSNQLRRNSLGLIAVTFMVISAAAPLTGVAGAMPLAFMLGNGAGIPATFIFVTLVMLAFSAGYVAMSRHVTNAGAFYAYAARGLGGRSAGAVALVALVAYNAMQFGLIGLLGGIASGVFSELGLVLPWWGWSLIAVVLVAILGYRQVDLSAKVLVVAVALEYLIVLIVDFAILGKGGDHGLALNVFDPAAMFSGSLTAAILFCLGSFIGFEATTIYAEEARDPERTIPRATYLSVLMIGIFFVFTTWLMIVGIGADKLVPTIQGYGDPSALFFDLAGRYVGGPIPTIAGILLVSSLFAALSAFHNYIARYSYVAGREGLLPAAFGRTHADHQSPHIGSVVQTIGALIVLAIFAGLGLDPVLNMFTWISQVGTLGVLGMMTVTSLSVIVFFRNKQAGAPALSTVVLPALSGLIMAALFVYIFLHFGDLTGTTGGALGVILPALIPAAAVVGYGLSLRLERADPARFARMGENQA